MSIEASNCNWVVAGEGAGPVTGVTATCKVTSSVVAGASSVVAGVMSLCAKFVSAVRLTFWLSAGNLTTSLQ